MLCKMCNGSGNMQQLYYTIDIMYIVSCDDYHALNVIRWMLCDLRNASDVIQKLYYALDIAHIMSCNGCLINCVMQ